MPQVESISSVPNVTVGYYVTRGGMVYTASVVVEALSLYGIERLMADIRQFVPLVQAVPMPAAPWRPSPAISLMLKTGQTYSSISIATDTLLLTMRKHTTNINTNQNKIKIYFCVCLHYTQKLMLVLMQVNTLSCVCLCSSEVCRSR